MAIDLEAEAKLGISIGELAKRMEALQRTLESGIPRFYDFAGAGTASSGAANFLITVQPAGPPNGKMWHIQRVSVAGSTASGAPGGAAILCVGMDPASFTQADIGFNFRDQSRTSIPVPALYNDGMIVVHYPQSVYFLITSPTASTAYQITGSVKEVNEGGPGVVEYPV